jgi:hypothetical protein
VQLARRRISYVTALEDVNARLGGGVVVGLLYGAKRVSAGGAENLNLHDTFL